MALFHWQDIRYALRLLAKSPLFTLLTVVVLAGGLGLSIFTFSFLHTAMLKPLPVEQGDAVVRVLGTRAGATTSIDAADLAAIRPSVRSLSALGAYSSRTLVLGGEQGGRLLDATTAEWNIFSVTRTRPALGRGFRADDQSIGAEPVVVLSHWAWRVVFGSDSGLVGRTISLGGVSTRVIGVMPPGYAFPVASEAWVPIPPQVLTATRAGISEVDVYARLAPGVTASEAESELSVLLERARRSRPPLPGVAADPIGAAVLSFPMAQIGEEGPLALAVLNTLAGLILLLACINVTNLLLARANERTREIAVRQALGASRGRLAVQCMWESVILCVLGGALATGLAALGLDAINAWAQANLEGNLAFWWVWRLDRTTLIAAGGFITLAIAGLAGVVGARAAGTRFNEVLRDGGARSGGRREGRLARRLVVTQVATVSVLMFFGTMSAIVAHRVATVDLGFDIRNLLRASVDLPADRYADRASRAVFFRALQEQLEQRPELTGAALRAGLGDIASADGRFEVGGGRQVAGAAPPRAFVQAVSGSMGPLGIALREGRFFDASDRESGMPSAVVSRALAGREWPGRSPIGQQVRLVGIGETSAWRTVVGVVSDVPMGNPLSRDRSAVAIYVPLEQTDLAGASVLVRHRGELRAGQAALYQTLAALDPLLAPSPADPYEEIVAKTTLMARSVTKLFGACFAFALLLAVSGTYGLMARSIGQRTREIGVRRALGASDGSILRLLVGQGGRQLGIGAVVALPVTALLGVGFTRFFPIAVSVSTLAAVAVSATITGVVLLATYLPTRKAIAVPPSEALRRD